LITLGKRSARDLIARNIADELVDNERGHEGLWIKPRS